jgi:choline dehydrogenase
MYDYVVVGGGSAGCVVASRLSEDAQRSVLLLEAGGEDSKQEIHVPAAFSKLFKSEVDWAYYTEPEPHANHRKLYWPRGKMLGGSSSINAMIYIRGNRRDYDQWAALGNEGWSFNDVLPYFKKAQHQERGASEYHGVGGPLNVAELRDPNPLSQAFIDASIELGIPRNPDFNGAEQDGVGYYQVTQKNGQRCSTAVAYLKPARSRANLVVTTHAQATRLLFDGKRVIGVAYQQHGEAKEARANKEVIVCGGAINSPQLLLLSGIGAAAQLQAHGINVVMDLPGVGQNLQDHPAFAVTYRCAQPITLASAETIVNLLKFLLFKKGPLTSNIAESGSFVKTKPDLAMPDLQYHFAPVYFMEHGFENPPKEHGFTLGVTLLHPQSRGQITLRSSDPLAPAKIEGNYFSDDGADLNTMVEGVKLARKIAQAQAFTPYRSHEVWPGSDKTSDAAIADFVRAHFQTLYHPVGTCKMGRDPLAVVDDHLRVHGVEGLRVADASIMPTLVGGNTNAPTIMIGERVADFIRKGM